MIRLLRYSQFAVVALGLGLANPVTSPAQAAGLPSGTGAYSQMACPLNTGSIIPYGPNYSIDWGHVNNDFVAYPSDTDLFTPATSSQVYSTVGFDRDAANTEAFFEADPIPSALNLSIYNQYTFTTNSTARPSYELYGFGFYFEHKIGKV